MSGSLHSRPSGPAYRLHGPAPRLLNQLCHLGEGTLVIRQQGLSLATTTTFGLFVASARAGWNLLRDAISGLEIDLRSPVCIHLYADPDDKRPVFAMSSPTRGIQCSIRLERQSWDSHLICALIEAFGGIPIDDSERSIHGAGAWLDEWENTSPISRGVRWDVLAAIDGCKCLEVEVRTGMHRTTAAFRPSFLDSEGPVLRIADASRKVVVFVDTRAPAFQWESLAPGHLKIRSEARMSPVRIAFPAA